MSFRIAACLILVATSNLMADDVIAPVDPQLGREVDFNLDVAPILESKCLACHSRTVHESDLVLERVETILAGGGSGPAVVPGKPDESLIYKVCSWSEEPFMPPQPNKAAAMPLTPRELGVLRMWIEAGAKPGQANPASSSFAWQTIPESIQAIYALSLSSDERFVAAARANRLVIYDLPSKREIAKLTDPAIRTVLGTDGAPLYETGAAHLDLIHALAFSPDGNWLASGGYREIKLWQRQRDIKLVEQALGAAAVSLAVNGDGSQAALVLNNNTVRIWNIVSGQPGVTVQGFPMPVTSVDFLPEGNRILTGSEDGLVRIVNSDDGQFLAEWNSGQPVKAVAVASDGKTALTGHADGRLQLWTIPDATPTEPAAPLKIIGDAGPAILSIQMREGANEAVVGSADGQVRRVNLESGGIELATNPGGAAAAVAISANGEILAAAATTANLARSWKRDGQQIADLKSDPALERVAIHAADDSTVAKAQAATADAAMKQAEKDVAEREDSLKKANEAKQKADEAVAEPQKKADESQQKLKAAQEALAGKPDDEALKKGVTDAEAEAKKTGEELQKAKDTVASAERAIQLSQQSIETGKKALEDRKSQLTAAQQNQQKREEGLNSAKQAAQQSPCPVGAVAISPDSSQVATAGDDGLIHLWDAATGKWLDTLHGHAGPIRSLAFTAAGALVSAGDDQKLIVWDVKPQWKLAAVLGGKPDNSIDISASPIVDRVLCLAFSPDGTRLASGGGEPSRGGEIIVWDMASREPVQTLRETHSDTVFGLDFSRDGALLASCGADKFVKVSEAATGKLIRTYEGHTGHVLDVCWKADGGTFASAGADASIKIWNVETGEQRRTINNYSKQVTSIQYIGVGDNLVSGSGDQNVKFHNEGNGGNYRTFGGATDYVFGVAATRDEGLVVAAGEDGVVRVWNGKDGQSIATFAPPAAAEGQTASR
jgi:WD40 repeat protein